MTEEEIQKNLGRGKDIRNYKFGKLTPLYPLSERKSGQIVWHCKCDCGNEYNVLRQSLINGKTKSCGCLQQIENKMKNLSNQKFGKLTAISPIGQRESDRKVIWNCRCDCGNIINVVSSDLIRGHVSSCGCLNQSRGEFLISKILTDNNITFQTEYTFETCVFADSQRKARFDFYVNNEYIIEFDGKQHFEPSKFFGGENALQKNQEHDNYKNQWCKDNNISIIRIPYTHLKNLCLEDLLLETSKFII